LRYACSHGFAAFTYRKDANLEGLRSASQPSKSRLAQPRVRTRPRYQAVLGIVYVDSDPGNVGSGAPAHLDTVPETLYRHPQGERPRSAWDTRRHTIDGAFLRRTPGSGHPLFRRSRPVRAPLLSITLLSLFRRLPLRFLLCLLSA
jgi:hypothetical protein